MNIRLLFNWLKYYFLRLKVLIEVGSYMRVFTVLLTFGKPHKLKHTLSTLSSKHDSMFNGKVCIGQK